MTSEIIIKQLWKNYRNPDKISNNEVFPEFEGPTTKAIVPDCIRPHKLFNTVEIFEPDNIPKHYQLAQTQKRNIE